MLEASGFIEPRFLHLVKGKLIQEGKVVLAAANLEEFPLEALVRLLEESQQYSPSDPIEAHPQIFAWALGFKEIQEHIHKRQMAEVVA